MLGLEPRADPGRLVRLVKSGCGSVGGGEEEEEEGRRHDGKGKRDRSRVQGVADGWRAANLSFSSAGDPKSNPTS